MIRTILFALVVVTTGCMDKSNPRKGTVYCPSAPPVVVDSAVHHWNDRDGLYVYTTQTSTAFPLRFSPSCSFRWGGV